MYINFELLLKSELKPYELLDLQAIKQKDDTMIASMEEKDLKKYELNGFVEKNKAGKYRLTKKGGTFLDTIETPEETEEAERASKEAIRMYEEAGKDIGVSRMEAKSRMAWFLAVTGFKTELVIQKIESYLTESGQYTLSLCNLIWKPPSAVFSVHKNLKDSKLFDLISSSFKFDNMAFFEARKSKEMEWLFGISRLPNPPKGNADILFTMDVRQEIERMKNIKTYLFNKIRKWRK